MKRRAAIHFLTKTCLYICGAMSATDPHISKHSYDIIVCSHSKVLPETVRLATGNELLLSAGAGFCTFLCLGAFFFSLPGDSGGSPPGLAQTRHAFASGLVSLLAEGRGSCFSFESPWQISIRSSNLCMLETSS